MNKFSKGKTIGIVAASLAAVSLIGVGFSAWVINGTKGTSTGDITVNVADVQDKRVEIQNASVTDSNIKFDSNNGTGGLLSGDGTNAEDLSFSISYTVKNYTKENNFKVFGYFSNSTIGTNFKDVAEKGLITLPYGIGDGTTADSKGQGVLVFDGTNLPKDGSNNNASIKTEITETVVSESYSVKQTFSFGWGMAFASKNPSEVSSSDTIYDYNRSDKSTTTTGNADTLKSNLFYLKSKIGTNVKFALTLSVEITNS